MYHPAPLRDIDRYCYGEFVRLGHALGGTGLPTTKAETLDCLESYLPKLALTHGAALATGAALQENPDVPPAAKFFDWAMRDAMPRWAAELVMYRPPHPVERAARRAATWAAINAAPRPRWVPCGSSGRRGAGSPGERWSSTPNRSMWPAAIPFAAGRHRKGVGPERPPGVPLYVCRISVR